MKRTITKTLALLAAFLGLHAFAVAPTPVAVFEGADLNAGTSGGYTLTLNGNTFSYGTVTIANDATKGVQVTPPDTTQNTVSILVRYSSLDQSTASDNPVFVSTSQGKNNATEYADVGVWASTTQFVGFWKDTGTYGAITYSAASAGYMLFTSSVNKNDTTGVFGYFGTKSGDTWTWSSRIGAVGLRFTGDGRYYDNFAIGGPNGTGANATSKPAFKGLKIEGIAIFNTRLTTAQAAEYRFPSEIPANARVINFNVNQNTLTTMPSVDQKTLLGTIPVAKWTTVGKPEQGSVSATANKAYNPSTGAESDISNVKMTSFCQDGSNWSYLGDTEKGGTAAEVPADQYAILKCFGSNRDRSLKNRAYVKIEDIPFAKYDIYFYFSGGTSGLGSGDPAIGAKSDLQSHFGVISRSDAEITSSTECFVPDATGALVARGENTYWGERVNAPTPVIGKNVVLLKDQTDANVTLGYIAANCAVAAVQIVDRTENYTATLAADKAFAELEWTPSKPSGGFTPGCVLTINNTAAAKLTFNEDLTVKTIKIENESGKALSLAYGAGKTVTAAWDFSAAAGGISFASLDGTELAKNAVVGAPYSYWAIKGAITGTPTVTCPTMPGDYTVTSQFVSGLGLRLVVTAPAMAKFGSIGLNFMGNTSKATSADNAKVGTLTTNVGVHPVVGTSWNDLEGKNQTSTAVTKYVDSTGTTVTTGNMSVTVAGVNNTYGTGAAAHSLFYGYLDDGGGPNVTVSNIPFSKYRVVVYSTTDNANYGMNAAQIGLTSSSTRYYYGPNYRGDAGATLSGSSAKVWGNSGSRADCIEGVNCVISDVLEGDSVYVKMTRSSDNRGCICAIQIVEVGNYVSSTKYAATISAAGNYDLSALGWGQAFNPTSADTVTVTVDGSVTDPVTINLDKASMSVDFIKIISAGSAQVNLTGNAPTAINTWNLSEAVGKTTVNFSTGSAAVTAGSDTVLTQAGSGTLTIASGKKATAPASWTGTKTPSAGGTLVLTGGGARNYDADMAASATVELAGDTAYTFNDNQRLTVKGTLRIAAPAETSTGSEIGMMDGTRLDIVNGGTFTIKGRFGMGWGANNQTMAINVDGGELASSGSSGYIYACNTYSGNTFNLNVSGGTASAVFGPYSGGVANNRANINVSGGVFAPTAIGTSNGSVVTPGAENVGTITSGKGVQMTMTGGAFNVPAQVPNWLPVNVNDNATIGVQSGVSAAAIRSAITIASDKTATIDVPNGATLTASGAMTGAGALAKTGAGTLVLSGANAYEGTTTVNAGTLKLTGSSIGTGHYTVNSPATLHVGENRSATVEGSSTGTIALTMTASEKEDFDANRPVEFLSVTGGAFNGTIVAYDQSGNSYDTDNVKVENNKITFTRKAGARIPPFNLVDKTGDLAWTTAGWKDSTPGTAEDVQPDDWAKPVSANISLASGTATLTADRALTLGTLAVTNAGTLTVSASGANTLAAGTLTLDNTGTLALTGDAFSAATAIDDSASTGATTIGFAPGSTPITAGANTILNTVGTGDLTIGSGKTLTVTASGLLKSKVTNDDNGTINVIGGTSADPVVVTNDQGGDTGFGGTMTIASGVVKDYASGSGNKKYGVSGVAGTTTLILDSNHDWGMTSGTSIRNTKVIVQGADFWWERAAAFDKTVDLEINKKLHLGNPDSAFEIGALSGTAAIQKDNANDVLTINMDRMSTTYSGASAVPFVVQGPNALTLTGANTGALTVNSGASVVISGDGAVGAATVSGNLTIAANKQTCNITLNSGAVLNVTGTPGQASYSITTGTFANDNGGTVRLNGTDLPTSDYMVVGNMIVRQKSATIDGNKTWAQLWEGGTSPESTEAVQLTVTANATLTFENSTTVAEIKVVSESGSKLTLADATNLHVTKLDLSAAAGGLEIDCTGLAGEQTILSATIVNPENITSANVPSGYTMVADATGIRIYRNDTGTRVNPVTGGDPQTFNFAFVGEDGAWGTLANWRTLADGMLKPYTYSTLPMVHNSDRWEPTLVDGALFENKTVTCTEIEGWNARLAVMGGAQLTIGSIRKFAGSSFWLWVDATSKLTISAFGGDTYTRGFDAYVASKDGLTFSAELNKDQSYNYYLKGLGSVKYAAGVTAGTHTIRQFQLAMGTGENKCIMRQPLVSFAEKSNTPTFTVANDATVSADDATTVKKLSAAPTLNDNYGDYFVSQESDGVYVTFVGRSIYATLTWDNATPGWKDAAGQSATPDANSILSLKDGDNVTFGSPAVTPHAVTMPLSGTVTFNDQQNLTVGAVNIPAAATLVLKTNNQAPGFNFAGAGTVAWDVGLGAEMSGFNGIASSKFADFTGTFHVKTGRYTANADAVIPAAVKIKVTNGGQIWPTGGTWSNRFILSGNGRGSGVNDVEYATIRIGATMADAAILEFVDEDGVVPGIGNTGAYTLGCTLTGSAGFATRGSGQATFSKPKTQATGLSGNVIVQAGNMQLGNVPGGSSEAAAAYSFGSKIVVKAGKELKFCVIRDRGASFNPTDKARLTTPVEYEGNGTLTIVDGAHWLNSLTIGGTVTMSCAYSKSWGFGELNGGAGTALTVALGNEDNYKQYFAVDGGDFNGTFTLNNNVNKDNADVWLGVKGTVFADATLSLGGNGKNIYPVLRDNASLGTVSGTKAGAIFGDNAATYTLTLAGGTVSPVIKDFAEGASTAHPLAVDVTGAVTLSGANAFTGALTVKDGGTLKMGAHNCLNGSNAVMVEAGGTLDVNNASGTDFALTLAGGTLVNTASSVITDNSRMMGSLTLTADSTVNLDGKNYGLVSWSWGTTSMKMNGHKLTKQGSGIFYLIGTTVSDAGTIDVRAGTLSLPNRGDYNCSFANGTIELNGGTLSIDSKTLTLKGLTVNGGTVSNSGTINNLAVLAGTAMNFGNVGGTIGFANEVTVASGTTTLGQAAATALAGKTVTVASGATLDFGTYRPANVIDKTSTGTLVFTLQGDEVAAWGNGQPVSFVKVDATEAGSFGGTVVVKDSTGAVKPGTYTIVQDGDDFKIQAKSNALPAADFPITANVTADDVDANGLADFKALAWKKGDGSGYTGGFDGVDLTAGKVSLTNTVTGMAEPLYLEIFNPSEVPAEFAGYKLFFGTLELVNNQQNEMWLYDYCTELGYQPGSLTAATLDDSKSTGPTVVSGTLAIANAIAGADTGFTGAGTVGTLTVNAGKKATVAAGVAVNAYSVSAGGALRYEKAVTNAPVVMTTGAIVSYAKAVFSTAVSNFGWILRLEQDADTAELTSATQFFPIDVRAGTLKLGGTAGEYVYGGANGGGTTTNSVITLNGGTIDATGITGTGTTSGTRGFIIGSTTKNITQHPTLVVNGGLFDISNGMLAIWEYCNVVVNGGTVKAKGISKGGSTESNFHLNGGRVEIGSSGLGTQGSGTFNVYLNGGQLVATDNAEVSVPMTVSSASTLSAAAGTTMTVDDVTVADGGSIMLDGAGTIIFKNYRDAVTFAADSTVKVGYTANVNDVGSFTVPGDIDMNRVEIYNRAGQKLEIKSTTGRTVTFDWEIEGAACWWDYEFENNPNNSGTDTTPLEEEGKGPYYRQDPESGVWSLRVGKATHYRSCTWPTQFTAAVYGRMISANGTVQLGFGNVAKSLFIATGDTSKNEVKLVASYGLNVAATNVCDMTVANAQTAKHLYVFMVSRSGGKTHLDIYLDGKVLQPFVFDGEISLANGFQIGSVHGGVTGIGYAKSTDEEENADLDFVRVYSEVLTPTAIEAMAEKYPYDSPNETYVRALTGAEGALWDSPDAWTVGGTTVSAPARNGIVELSASADSTLAVNLYGDTTFESLEFGGTAKITLVQAAGTTGKVTPTGSVAVDTDTTFAYGAIDAKGTPITVAAGKTLAFDMSGFKLDTVPGDMTFDLTGYVTLGAGANVTWIPPAAIEGWSAAFARNEHNGHYEMTVTVDTSKIFGSYVKGLHISEICPKPDYADRDPNGRQSGWIELVNYGPEAVNLSEYKIVRSNIGKESKAKDNQMSYLQPLELAAGERTVVYTSEDYPSAEDHGGSTKPLQVKWYRTEAGEVIEGAGEGAIMVVPTKVNPKKYPMVRLYKGASTVVDEVIIPCEIDDAVAVALGYNTNRLDRFILKTPTKGALNDYSGVVQYGPEVNMVYGYKVDDKTYPDVKIGDLALLNSHDGFVPAEAPFEITMPVNPFWTNGKVLPDNEIAAVTLEYRIFETNADVAVKTVPMVRYTGALTPAETNMYGTGCWLWKATIPAADLVAGSLVQYRAKIVDASGSAYTAPRFWNPNLGYEWYGAVVQPVIAANPPTAETVLTTTDVCTNSLQTFLMFASGASVSQMDKDIEKQDKTKCPYGARIAIYDTQTHTYYDNVRVDLRGQTSASFLKKSHGFRFNKVAPLKCVNPFDPDEKIETRKTSFIAEYGDPAYIRQTLALQVMRESGVKAPFDYPVRLYLNGKYYQLAFHSNRFSDEIVEDYYGLNPNGYSYKNVGELVSDNYGHTDQNPKNFSSTGTEKKTPDDDNEKDLAVLTAYADRIWDDFAANRTVVAMTNFNLAAWINYLAAVKVTQEADDVWTNLGIYIDKYDKWYNPCGDDTMMPIAYDQNLSFGQWYRGDDASRYAAEPGIVATNDLMKSHPFYGGKEILYHFYNNTTMNRWNRGMETILQNETFRKALVRRLRTLSDKFYGSTAATKEQTPIWNWVVAYTNAISGDIAAEHAKWDYANIGKDGEHASAIWVWPSAANAPSFEEGIDDLWTNFIVPRRRHLHDYHAAKNAGKDGYPAEIGYAATKSAGIPESQAATESFGLHGTLYFVDVNGKKPGETDFNLDVEGGIIGICNANDVAIDVSGWTVEGAVVATLKPGTVIPAHGILWVVENRTAAAQAVIDAKGVNFPVIVNLDKTLVDKNGDRTEFFNTESTELFLKDADGTPAISHEAMIGTKYYITLVDALRGAAADDVVTMLTDVDTGTTKASVNNSMALYGDTNTLAGAGFNVAAGKTLTVVSGKIAVGALAKTGDGAIVLVGGKYTAEGKAAYEAAGIVSNQYHMAALGLPEGDYTYQVIPGATAAADEIILPVAEVAAETSVTNDTGVLAFSKAWLKEKGLATDEQLASETGKKQVVDNLNEHQENNIQVWENKVLGLDGTKQADIPFVAPIQVSGKPTVVGFKIGDNVKVDASSGAIVTYRVLTADSTGAETWTPVTETTAHDVMTEVGLPESGVKYYKLEVTTTPAK